MSNFFSPVGPMGPVVPTSVKLSKMAGKVGAGIGLGVGISSALQQFQNARTGSERLRAIASGIFSAIAGGK